MKFEERLCEFVTHSLENFVTTVQQIHFGGGGTKQKTKQKPQKTIKQKTKRKTTTIKNAHPPDQRNRKHKQNPNQQQT